MNSTTDVKMKKKNEKKKLGEGKKLGRPGGLEGRH